MSTIAWGGLGGFYTPKFGEYYADLDVVTDAQYGPAGELLQMTYHTTNYAAQSGLLDDTYTVSYQHNPLLQMTRLSAAWQVYYMHTTLPPIDLEYRYSATQNNGRITSTKDNITGEEVSYSYDSLQRLIAAATTGPDWGLSFTYDGFGNLTQRTVTKGAAPSGNPGQYTKKSFKTSADAVALRMYMSQSRRPVCRVWHTISRQCGSWPANGFFTRCCQFHNAPGITTIVIQ